MLDQALSKEGERAQNKVLHTFMRLRHTVDLAKQMPRLIHFHKWLHDTFGYWYTEEEVHQVGSIV